jgi:hypothetical protein
LANPLSKMRSQAGKVAVHAIDHVVVNRFHDAEVLVERARKALPQGTRTQVADAIIRRVSKEMAAVGAASGAVAAPQHQLRPQRPTSAWRSDALQRW